ncbi:MAG TPA: phosphoglycerate kinase [Oligoflexia bacterium]|nr:phosphoglycerate kinase [Oligoflexia bacterium]HMP27027.1 phosphoglycerate kinase [Oligoflexia bacterium]
MKFLSDLNLSGRRVLVRADLNVPLSDDGQAIADDNRIRAFVPTLNFIIERGGKPVVISHFGSPAGKVDPKLSLRICAERLSQLADRLVKFIAQPLSDTAVSEVAALVDGEVALCENLRFDIGEESNSKEFASRLARLGDCYVNDAFGTAHRAHASIVSLPKFFKEKAAGLLMQKEFEFYERALLNPKRPLVVIIGGAKVSSKLGVLRNLAAKADRMLIGGAMANTFLAAQGLQMGRSLYEPDLLPQALEIIAAMARRECKLYLPVDLVVAPDLTAKGLDRVVTAQDVPADMMALDIGPATCSLFKTALTNAETILWNGPMGAFEREPFDAGTLALTESIAATSALKVAGGGDTDAAIHAMELEHKFSFISTGGGAFLEMIEGKTLPAVEALGGI